MLNVLRSRCLAPSKFISSVGSFQSRWSTSLEQYEHTIQVRKDIEHQRDLSRQGGGLKRIASQHKKVAFKIMKIGSILTNDRKKCFNGYRES